MAEEGGEYGGDEVEPGLGSHDVKTGIYEGGFKSWESSVDLVKVLAAEDFPGNLAEGSCRIMEVSGQRYGLAWRPSVHTSIPRTPGQSGVSLTFFRLQ